MEEDRISYLSVENVGGLTNAEVHFGERQPGKGKVVWLIGPNASGKTSLLNGVRALFSGGHTPEIIREGADKAVIQMHTMGGVEYTRTVTRKGYYITGFGSDGLKFDPPESEMKGLASGIGFDPVSFDLLSLSRDGRKKQVEFFLKYLPMTFTAAEILTAMKGAAEIVPPPEGDLDISAVNKLLKDLVEKRAKINDSKEEKAKSANGLRVSLPKEDSAETPKDWRAEVARLTKERNDLEASELADVEHINKSLKEALDVQAKHIRTLEDTISTEFQRLLGIARTGRSSNTLEGGTLIDAITDVQDHYQQCKDHAAEADEAIAKIKTENAVIREKIAGDMATAQAGNDAQQRFSGIRDSMASLQKEAQTLSVKWDIVAGAVKSIESLKKSKLAELQVEGVDLREDGLYLDGLPWGSVNQARRWLKAIDVGCQGLGKSRFLIADEAEHLDAANQAEFEQAVIESGITVLAARVASPEEIKKHGRKLRSEPASALVMA